MDRRGRGPAGVLAYGSSRDDAVAKAKALAFRVLADRLEHGETVPELAVRRPHPLRPANGHNHIGARADFLLKLSSRRS